MKEKVYIAIIYWKFNIHIYKYKSSYKLIHRKILIQLYWEIEKFLISNSFRDYDNN